MPRDLPLTEVEPILTTADLETRYRQARDPVLRSHYQIIWLRSQGYSLPQIAAATGYAVRWLSVICHRYRDQGVAGLGDRRHANRGGTRLLSDADDLALATALTGPPPAGEVWTGPQVAIWLSQRLGRPVRKQRAWEALRRLGWTPQQPRPAALQADLVAQAAFKKGGSPAS